MKEIIREEGKKKKDRKREERGKKKEKVTRRIAREGRQRKKRAERNVRKRKDRKVEEAGDKMDEVARGLALHGRLFQLISYSPTRPRTSSTFVVSRLMMDYFFFLLALLCPSFLPVSFSHFLFHHTFSTFVFLLSFS